MAKVLNIKEDLKRKIRECSLSGSEVLRSLDKAVSKLEDFAKIMAPMQEAVQKLDEASTSIDKTLNQVRDQAQCSRESMVVIRELASPSDLRSHIKNMDKAISLLQYYQRNQNLNESQDMHEKLSQGLTIGYGNCVKFIEEQIVKYNEIYGISPISQENAAQVDMIDTIKELIEICKAKAPQFWHNYVKLRSGLICRYLNLPSKVVEPYKKGSHYLIGTLKAFLKVCSVEKELLACILDTQTVQDWLGEVTEAGFQHLTSQTEAFLSRKAEISISLDIFAHFSNSLQEIESYFGKSVKYYTASKLQTTLMQKCQSWYREYIQHIQSNKIEFGDNVNEMSITLASELKLLMQFSEAIAIAKLEQSIGHLVTSLIDTYRIKIKVLIPKQQGLCQMFMINNLSFWIAALQELDISGVEDTMSRIEKEMISEIEEYIKNCWSKLLPVLSDSPTVIEFKKPGVLARWSRKAVKNKLKSFNTVFPEILNYHKNFTVFNREILQLLRRKSYTLIIPQYKEFLKRYLAVDFTTRREKYTLFTLESVEQSISNMYALRKP